MSLVDDLSKLTSTLISSVSELEKNTHKKAKHKQWHMLYDDELEQFISLAIADGKLTPKEKFEARLANRREAHKSTQMGIRRQRRGKILSSIPEIVACLIILLLCILEWVYKYSDWGGLGVGLANVLTIVLLGAIFGAIIFFVRIFL